VYKITTKELEKIMDYLECNELIIKEDGKVYVNDTYVDIYYIISKLKIGGFI